MAVIRIAWLAAWASPDEGRDDSDESVANEEEGTRPSPTTDVVATQMPNPAGVLYSQRLVFNLARCPIRRSIAIPAT
jgi:hypothetical protein